ncbi:DUF2865 domain-containing protein [Bosea sp. (in: a-proteobacteria)]|uniref:DUF2865 domain-containing protein n=1 Tax=Bosea sp. (in: a-proteobacteria) TaxID=1871050 RepID=UPI00333F21DF
MSRVRDVSEQAAACGGQALVAAFRQSHPPSTGTGRGTRPRRLAAMAAAGLALGAGGMILTASLVQAGDDSGIHAFFLEEAARRAERSAGLAARANSYAPAESGWRLPLFRTGGDGRIAQPAVDLNPFRRQASRPKARAAKAAAAPARAGTFSGSARTAQTICVRLCDGFHSPIGQLRSTSDLKAHQALCEAMNPGLPVKVFTVAAGATSIDRAVAADGQRYGALATAYRHETVADPACRLPIAKAGEHRVSLLRDITLRPGDSIVLDGKVTTFMGGSSWPYSRRDFRDFRSAPELSKAQRRQIDEQVGISRMEAQARNLRRQMRVREASLAPDTVSDAFLRGSFDPGAAHGPVRMIPLVLAAQ